MRTTLSLDDDVASLLAKEAKESAASFKATVNHFLRLGLMAAKLQTSSKRFVVTPRKMGLPPGESYDDVEHLLEALEGVRHR